MLSDELPKFPTEHELREAIVTGASVTECPNDFTLNNFVEGKYKIEDPALTLILDHLADCPQCEKKLANIRLQRERAFGADAGGQKNGDRVIEIERYRAPTYRTRWRAALALVAVALLAIASATLFWVNWHHGTPQTVAVDLRNLTRGIESPRTPMATVLHRGPVQIRLFLSEEAVEGTYEVGIFAPADRDSPLVTSSGTTNRDKSAEILQVTFELGKLRSGAYLLGIRHLPTSYFPHSEWIYYPIGLE